MGSRWRGLSSLIGMLATASLCACFPVTALSAQLKPSHPSSAAINVPATTTSQASAEALVKVFPHALRRDSKQATNFTDFTPPQLVESDSAGILSAHADVAFAAHIASSEDEVDVTTSGVLDARSTRTAISGSPDPESDADASLVVHVRLAGDIPYSLDATLNTSGHAHPCVTVKVRLAGDTPAENLNARGPRTATDAGCGAGVPEQVHKSVTGVVHSSGDIQFNFDAEVVGIIDPGDVRTDSLHADWDVVLKLNPPTSCALSGVVRDGAETDGHQNPLEGVRVQLWRDGSPVGNRVATDATGMYCIPAEPGVNDPGDYMLRATLIDAIGNPPLFETRYATETEATFQEVPVTQADFGRTDEGVVFTTPGADTSSVPRNLADIANIHWQSTRFIDWIIHKLGISPATFGQVTIVTFDTTNGDSSFEQGSTVHISAVKSPYSVPHEPDAIDLGRDLPDSNGPENAEWHEITHYLEDRLGIAPIDSQPCAGRTPHAGWLNSSTCDSLQEGFAMFLPTLASLDIDAGRETDGYATAEYAGFGSLESNNFVPWTAVTADDGSKLQREDLAVAQLLWDLADDTPAEHDSIYSIDPAAAAGTFFIGKDESALGGLALVHLLAAAKPQTIADVYRALQADPSLRASLKAKTVDITGDGHPDVSPLDEVFLLHDFHPVHDINDPGFTLGDSIARTDHVPDSSGGLVLRNDIPELSGSAIRFVNSSNSVETFDLDITYPTTSSHFAIPVPASSSLLVHQEVPPYWRQVLAPGAELPACGGKDQRLVTIKLSGPGLASQTLDNCEYLHDVLNATDGAAITFGGSLASPSSVPTASAPPSVSASPSASEQPSASGSPVASPPAVTTPPGQPIDNQTILLIVVLGAAVIIVVAGFLLVRRRQVR